ncbi:hypothetical protein [Leeuwenhoekiella marinoflava]|uniref:Uncharacterized protein n=2 Tax=Leeuwenhoekiella marinoflava TaxID=988 RepID=A0A4Q0PNE9_9FLAO|nr:hypothetical protein [Leeuwenhoekiella marinoflava]RXG32027.1 hypothetical protein DSL99_1332 [Leeuwenhoekiella marinoflava]SHE95453.1 hypothetical protein SAMN02745246_01388 [Leeuwenhoekiella marinoflava DSM 3653]
MNKIVLNKLKPDDLSTLNEACVLYDQYLDFFAQAEPGPAILIYKSIALELAYTLAGRLKVRRVPATSLLNLEVHSAFILQNALMHYNGKVEHSLERARAYRLLERVNQLLPVTVAQP